MRGYSVSWNPPDLGRALTRRTIGGMLESAGGRTRWLYGPAGSGKTFLAAQYAKSASGPMLWVDAGGRSPEPAAIAAEVLERLSGNELRAAANVRRAMSRGLRELLELCAECSLGMLPTQGHLTMVVDGLRVGAPEEQSGYDDLLGAMRVAGICTLITSQDPPPSGLPSDALVLGPRDLFLSIAEARSSSSLTGVDPASLESLHSACAGHPGMFFLSAQRGDLAAADCWSGVNDQEAKWLDALTCGSLNPADRDCLTAASLIKTGSMKDLESLGVSDPERRMSHMCSAMPLVNVIKGSARVAEFEVHDVLAATILRVLDESNRPMALDAARLLSARGDVSRSSRIAANHGCDQDRARWVEEYGEALLDDGDTVTVSDLLHGFPLRLALERPRVVAVWARLLLETDQPEEALAKARAGVRLAKQLGDAASAVGAQLTLMKALAVLDRQESRIAECRELRSLLSDEVDESLRAAALLQIASALTCCGDLGNAEAAIAEAGQLLASRADEVTRCEIDLRDALLRGLSRGAFRDSCARISRVLATQARCVPDRTIWRGNLAACLVETGRLERALALLEYTLGRASAYDLSAFLAVRCMAHAGAGSSELDAEVEEAFAASVVIGHDSDLAMNRTYFAVIARAAGHADSALEIAERAYEVLCGVDYVGFRQLAVIEVAASLVALGDPSAALRWLQELDSDALRRNQYHGLRAAMVAAECDRLDGRTDDAIHAIAEYGPHVLSESSNWQVAMYCRAFPHLLGMFATAIGADQLPVHMLRMILPEYAERSLEAAMGWMDQAEWERLGIRLLGEEQFEQLKRRSGKPLCHVRMFGGLEVTIGQKVLGERDWGKRKARLLFAMIAARRGADVPREQILDQLWPDLEPERARNNFYVVWSTMKAALTPEGETPGRTCPYVESFRGRCRITRSAVRMDLDDLETAMVDLKAAEEATDVEAVLDALRRISAAYRGDFLPGDVYEECFGPLRDSYRFDFLSAMSRGAAKLIALGEPAEALVFARRGLQVDATREDLYQLALRAHIDSGQRSAAIETFLQCRSQLVDELGLDPSAETIALYEEILAMEERTDFDSAGLAG